MNELEQLKQIIKTLKPHEKIEISRDRDNVEKVSITIKSTYRQVLYVPYEENV